MGCCCFAGLEVSPEPRPCKGSLYHSAVLLPLNPWPLFHPPSSLCSFLSVLLCVGGNRSVGKKNWGRKRTAFELEDTFRVSCILAHETTVFKMLYFGAADAFVALFYLELSGTVAISFMHSTPPQDNGTSCCFIHGNHLM